MERLKQALHVATTVLALGISGVAMGQATPVIVPPPAKAPAAAPAKPLQLHSLSPDTVADPFPPVNPKYFTAEAPTVATVDSYLHVMLGYDANRIWRVVAIQKTPAVGVAKVTALVSEKTPNAKVQQAVFFTLPDGKHLIADNSGVLPFGAQPYAEYRSELQARADGPHVGAEGKELMLVEFSDLQCPHCKDAQAVMKRLEADFPQARVVYQSYPLTEIHPFAFEAAAYGVCIEKKSTAAYMTYAQAVYDTQAQLTPEAGANTLKAAVTKAGGDSAAVATCADSAETKAAVNSSLKLGQDVSVDQTPTLMVNGRSMPLAGIPYETLRQVIVYQAGLDGVKTSPASALAPPAAAPGNTTAPSVPAAPQN